MPWVSSCWHGASSSLTPSSINTLCLSPPCHPQVHLHSSVQHENIITMHAAFQEGDKVVMVQVRERSGRFGPRC